MTPAQLSGRSGWFALLALALLVGCESHPDMRCIQTRRSTCVRTNVIGKVVLSHREACDECVMWVRVDTMQRDAMEGGAK